MVMKALLWVKDHSSHLWILVISHSPAAVIRDRGKVFLISGEHQTHQGCVFTMSVLNPMLESESMAP